MNTFFRLVVVAMLLSALAGLAGLLPEAISSVAQWLTAVIIGLHTVELAVAFKHVRRYQGPLLVSILLTLVFGMLHWKPLAEQGSAPPTEG